MSCLGSLYDGRMAGNWTCDLQTASPKPYHCNTTAEEGSSRWNFSAAGAPNTSCSGIRCLPVVALYAHLNRENGLNKFSLQAKTAAFQLVASHKVVGMEVESWPTIYDVGYDLSKAASLIAIKHVMVGLQVAVEQLHSTASTAIKWTKWLVA